MDFLLNEKSLHGQFESTEEFLKSLSENLSCFQLVTKKMAGRIWKITDFYKCKITGDITIADHHMLTRYWMWRQGRIRTGFVPFIQPVTWWNLLKRTWI